MTEIDRKFFTNLVNDLCNDYAFHRDVANKIAMKALKDVLYFDGNKLVYDKVVSRAHEISEFVEGVLWLEMGRAGNHCFDESKCTGSKAYKKFAEPENNC